MSSGCIDKLTKRIQLDSKTGIVSCFYGSVMVFAIQKERIGIEEGDDVLNLVKSIGSLDKTINYLLKNFSCLTDS